MTNKDKIQQMSVWDLAEFIFEVSNWQKEITTCKENCDVCKCSDGYCIYEIAEWLGSEAE